MAFTKKILDWYGENARDFPWRLDSDPYSVLVAEIMLQRTRADIVAKVFTIFVREFDNPRTITKSPHRVRELLAGLGLTHRIPRFLELMTVINNKYGGIIPDDVEELKRLPGVGRYIAGAILCFGFGREIAVVDVNIARVLTRYFGLESRSRPQNDRSLWLLTSSLLPRKHAKEFNWALIDFASLICTKRNPKCSVCPVKEACISRQKNIFR